ncbi:type II toxin-antitoxin system RelE/ParE family toxin [Gracilimonas tropica]|uniref:type II toxin-antitoxin system RelE/ParE family toxin n=1 Tax=Gracilimonas tropica TaxID=454600 RepID=UPI00036D63CD|nr:type II toxin-antitoxin system RelE/ParE family toxin [Gracilimonas tropica]
MKIIWSKKSEKQLDQIYDYIAQDSPFYANSTILEIINRAEKVVTQPLQGRIVPEYKKDSIREVFVHPYRIMYEVREEVLFVLTVVHEARMPPKKL